MLEDIDIPYKMTASESMITGGQPDEQQMQAAADAGVRHVINLRPVEEQGGDEAPAVERLGMVYHHLPVAGPQDINRDTVARLDAILAKTGSEATLFHCATGNRVGALLALRAAWHEGKAPADALDYGRQTGMTKLEPLVVRLLENEG